MTRFPGWALIAFALAGCGAPLRPTAPRPTAPRPAAGATSVESLAATIAADADRSDQVTDSTTRGELAADATRAAQDCIAREPKAVACVYGRAVASGLQARAHPTRAGELLTTMLRDLAEAEAIDPSYDNAGPARVQALVLLKAPGWPLGPGDDASALIAARRAALLRPQYPPNGLTLAEVLVKTGDTNGARDAYKQARDAAQALPSSPNKDTWLRQADAGLRP